MRLPSMLARMLGKSAEGSYRGPALGYSSWGNPFEIPFGDGFQTGLTLATTPYGARAVPIAFSCVMLNAKAIALCPASHLVLTDGQWVKSTTSPASRLLRYPNSYQTWSQFILNALAMMLFEGEAFALIMRDARFAPVAFHLMPRHGTTPYVDQESGEIFYGVGSNPMLPVGFSMMVPQRDVIHFRQYTPRHPLIGETALKASALAMQINVALSANQAAFFSQMSRPSGILTTEEKLTRTQIQELRAAWEDQAKGFNAGKTPIASHGLKWEQLSINSQDAELIAAQRMSIEDVARVMGVPLPLIGDPSTGGVNNTETLINFWLAMGLGSLIENVESSLEKAFDFGVGDEIEFDVNALLRTDMKTRLEALSKGIQGGIYTSDEARAKENLPPVDGGDVVFMQRQMTPIDLLTDIAKADLAKALAPTPPTTSPATANPNEPDPNAPTPDEENVDAEATAKFVRDMIRRKTA